MSDSQQIRFSDVKNREKVSMCNKLRYEKMTPDERKSFSDKMSVVNKDPNKRKSAGAAIAKKWEDPIFLEKMKNRKNKKSTYEAISPNGDYHIVDGLDELCNKFLLNLTLVNKYKDTGEPIKCDTKRKGVSDELLNSVGWIVNTLTNRHIIHKTTKRNPTYNLISPIGEKFECIGLKNLCLTFNFNGYFVNKFKNTGSPISCNKYKDTTTMPDNIKNMLGWLIYEIKN